MRLIKKNLQPFVNLNVQYAANKLKSAVRFQSQNLNWDFDVVDYHCKAFSKGLKSLNFQKGTYYPSIDNNFLIRTHPSQQAEAYVTKVGTYYINANLIISNAKTVDQLRQQLLKYKINAFIFEPTLPLDNGTVIDGLYKLMPQIKNQIQGSPLKPINFNSLRFLFQTNFYTYPGIYKYRSIFNYSNGDFIPFTQIQQPQPIQLTNKQNVIIITQPAHKFAFKAGILNSLVNGRFIVCAQKKDVQRISQIYDGNVDFINTQDIHVNNSKIKVYQEIKQQ